MQVKKYKYYTGVDVGILGGVVVLDVFGRIIRKFKMPKTKDDFGKEVMDLNKLALYLKEITELGDCLVLIEKNKNIRGVASNSNHSFGKREGEIVGITHALKLFIDLDHLLVPPKEWQKPIWIKEDKAYISRTKLNTKATSLNAAYRLFPDETFYATERSYTPHDGIVDAALIALYGYLINTE